MCDFYEKLGMVSYLKFEGIGLNVKEILKYINILSFCHTIQVKIKIRMYVLIKASSLYSKVC